MSDPLSVAASIAGLLSLAGQVYTTLDTFITNVQGAPSFANRIRIEVDSFRRSLNALHTLLSPWTAPPKRAALIPADFIVLTFTDATLLFSEIEAEILPLIQLHDFDFVARARWARKKTQLETLVSRLQWQKLTLVLQLNILKCASENDAHKELAELTQNCMQKLADNQDLERRLGLVEAQLQQNTLGDSTTIRSDRSDGSDLTVRPIGKGILDAYPIQHEFEQTLYASWVYRRNQNRRESMSIRSSVIRESAWSALSELSLAQISIISVIALPVQRSELFNAQWYALNENQGEEAKDGRKTGKVALGSKDQLSGSSPANRYDISYNEQQHGLSNTGDEGSANTLEHSEVNQGMLEEGISDSDIAEIELLLQGTADTLPSEHQKPEKAHTERDTTTTSSIKHVGKPRRVTTTNLSKALQKANIAVIRDNNHDYPGAIDSYTEACNILRQMNDKVADSEDRRRLESIRATYAARITQLMEVLAVEQNESIMKLHSELIQTETEGKV